MTTQLRYAAFSDVGLIRKNNQDGGYASPHMLVLADGMGGAAGGDIASSVTVAHLAANDDVHPAEDLLPLLRRSLNEAHDELIERVEEKPSLAGLGTTCIAIMRSNNKLAMVHIGDSRAYLLRDGALTQVTKDHTLVQYLVDVGKITAEEAEHHPQRNVIMRAVGDSPGELELDESVREAIPGDRWLLCSDGLFGVVSHDTIEHTLLTYKDVDECGEHLIDLALAGGAPDNVTVVIADVVATSDPTSKEKTDRGPIVVGSAAIDHSRPSRAGSSAAGQAARLNTPAPLSDPEDEEEILDDEPPRRIWARLAVALTVIGLIIGGTVAGYRWTQTQYYVAPAGDKVAVYQGIPQDIGPISLSHVHEVTDIVIDKLTPVAQERLDTPITRGSLAEAREVVSALQAQVVLEAPPTPQPTATPSAFPGVVPSPSATPGTNPSATPAPSSSPAPSPSATSSPKATP